GDAEPILAVVWRSQRGTEHVVSVPVAVVDYAERAGARFLFVRDDRRKLLARLPLAKVRAGWLRPDGELYVPLGVFDSVPWRGWRSAETTVDLETPTPAPQARAKQPALPGFAEALR